MDRWMDGWMGGWIDRQTGRQADRQTTQDEMRYDSIRQDRQIMIVSYIDQINRQMVRWSDGWMDGRTDGWMDEQPGKQAYILAHGP